MLVAKLPGSTYATAATKAGPRNGRRGRGPLVCPLSAFSAARRTRSSPGRATATGSGGALTGRGVRGSKVGLGVGASTATLARSLHEHATRKAERDADAPAFDPDLDRALVLAHRDHLDPRPPHQAAALELTEPAGILVRDTLDHDLLACAALAQGTLAEGAHLAGHAGNGVAVRVELGTPEKLEDPLLHPFRHHVLQALGLVVDLVPAVAKDLDQEHLEEPVMPHQLEGDLAAFTRQLLASVAVVLD